VTVSACSPHELGEAGKQVLGLPSATTLPEARILAPRYDAAGLSVQHGGIVVAVKVYGPEDSHAAGPSERITVRWHWEEHRCVRLPM
jgi:hypothetical protein